MPHGKKCNTCDLHSSIASKCLFYCSKSTYRIYYLGFRYMYIHIHGINLKFIALCLLFLLSFPRVLDMCDDNSYDGDAVKDFLTVHSEQLGIEEQRVLTKICEIKEGMRVSVCVVNLRHLGSLSLVCQSVCPCVCVCVCVCVRARACVRVCLCSFWLTW